MCFQVAVKNSIDIFYFACIAPLHIFFSEEGKPVFFSISVLIRLEILLWI